MECFVVRAYTKYNLRFNVTQRPVNGDFAEKKASRLIIKKFAI